MPAVVISPLIPKNVVDHRVYDHASVPATLENLFGLSALTARDAHANRVDALCTLDTARGDAPTVLPAPASSIVSTAAVVAPPPNLATAAVTAPNQPVNQGNLPAVLHSALQQDLALSPAEARTAIVARVAHMVNRADAFQYMAEVQQKLRSVQAAGAK